jgi:tRNA(fMet)-specific endonuclease VapC
MVEYLLDTDTCVYWLNGDRRVEARLLKVGLERAALSAVTLCELYYGAYKSSRVEENLETLRFLQERLRTLPVPPEAAPRFGKIKAELEKRGKRLDGADLLIASIALHAGAVLVTNNLRHFSPVPALRLENWRQG